MTSRTAFLRAVIPEPCRVLGLKLRPYSLGHHLLLQRLGSPVTEGGRVGVEDLIQAVFICAHTFEDNVALLDSEDFWRVMAKWRRQVFRRCFGLFPRRIDMAEKFTLFRDYIEDGMKRPKFWADSKPVSPQGAPVEQTMRVALVRELGLSDSEVLNRPLALCWWDYVALAEANGRVTIFDPEKYQRLQAFANEAAERLGKGGN